MNYKKWYESKVNWIQIFGLAAQGAIWMGWAVPVDLQIQAAAMMVGAQSVLTLIMRTWFTTKLVEESKVKS